MTQTEIAPTRRRLRRVGRRLRSIVTSATLAGATLAVIASEGGAQAGTPRTGAPTSDSLRVLFIGNSFTYFNNLPALIEGLAASDGASPSIATGMLAPGGMTLRAHLDGGKPDRALDDGRWNVVVLQEQSALANPVRRGGSVEPGSPERFHAAARALDSAIRRRGARTVLYQTWARADQPQHTETIARAYDVLARELGVALAPVGRAFALAREERPALALHIEDGSHPTAAGSYLAACVLYATLTTRPLQGLPRRLTGRAISHDGEPVGTATAVLVDLDESDARFLQDVASRAVREQQRRGGR